ncbi:allantoate amidohydrolase [Aeromicrobium terrae]|uniref:Allantoate amidohydrolase n=1 Tax=Aeromicrobium terrae TaxID=2498846 RepID=A0A5C8NFF7_9ACTN|nr:allantoate amidohydrolase [Aeromicrobium terrae]TXL57653.1 allantoate amidohydrolase [Aeromicrobium terrae]
MLDAIAGIGRRAASGGYRRFAWSDADMELREWFCGEAESRGMEVTEDGNGNQLAWTHFGSDALLLGSHLDSVPDGGAFDGPLGIVSAFAALDRVPDRDRPVVVANFADEEGARFGIACVGSQLATGALDPAKALGLRDRDGRTLAELMIVHGRDPKATGRAEWLQHVGTAVELHVEQGRHLVHTGDAVGVATAIWPHGRWRLDFCGEANHAGATAMGDRRDPMTAYAATVLAAQRLADDGDTRATFGRLEVEPNGTNAVPSRVTAWLDARAEDQGELEQLVERITAEAQRASEGEETTVELTAESVSPAVEFDVPLRDQLASLLDAPVLPTAAGHDAGVLSKQLPTAMLFVRNPTGVSHSPAEHAEEDDCEAGVDALARVIQELT